jgi:hypothetical protein
LVGEELRVTKRHAEDVCRYYDGILSGTVFWIGKVRAYYTCVSLKYDGGGDSRIGHKGNLTISDILDFAFGSAGVEGAGYAAFAHGV